MHAGQNGKKNKKEHKYVMVSVDLQLLLQLKPAKCTSCEHV